MEVVTSADNTFWKKHKSVDCLNGQASCSECPLRAISAAVTVSFMNNPSPEVGTGRHTNRKSNAR